MLKYDRFSLFNNFISISHIFLCAYTIHPSSMRRQTTLRLRNNPLHVDLFERSLQSPTSFKSFWTVEPVEMALNDKGNTVKCLSDYARPVLQSWVTRIHTRLNRGPHFRINSYVMSILPIFHGKPFKDPYRHMDELLAKYVKSIKCIISRKM